MKLHNAMNIIYRSLVAYIEDSAGQGSEEAKEIDEAYSLVNSKCKSNKLLTKILSISIRIYYLFIITRY